MRSILGGLAVVLLFGTGCGSGASLKKDPADVTGKVTMNGAPLGGVQLVLQPTSSDLSVPAFANLGPDGAFAVKLIPGKYVYYFQAREGRPNELAAFNAAYQKVPAAYRTADKDHTVEVKAGEIAIDVK